MSLWNLFILCSSMLVSVATAPAEAPPSSAPQAAAPSGAKTPTLWIIGDSTVRNNDKVFRGWGDLVSPLLAPGVVVKNKAIGGRSSRTFFTEGRWDEVEKELQPGDVVLMQFGHNDNGPMDKGRARASIKGNGDQTQVVTVEGKTTSETVHSYGWYLRHYATRAQAKGALPVILSLVPRNMWKDGKVNRATQDYTAWAQAAATQVSAAFIDLNGLVADRYQQLGPEAVAKFFTEKDHTHTNEAGARLNAECVAAGIHSLPALKPLHRSAAALTR